MRQPCKCRWSCAVAGCCGGLCLHEEHWQTHAKTKIHKNTGCVCVYFVVVFVFFVFVKCVKPFFESFSFFFQRCLSHVFSIICLSHSFPSRLFNHLFNHFRSLSNSLKWFHAFFQFLLSHIFLKHFCAFSKAITWFQSFLCSFCQLERSAFNHVGESLCWIIVLDHFSQYLFDILFAIIFCSHFFSISCFNHFLRSRFCISLLSILQKQWFKQSIQKNITNRHKNRTQPHKNTQTNHKQTPKDTPTKTTTRNKTQKKHPLSLLRSSQKHTLKTHKNTLGVVVAVFCGCVRVVLFVLLQFFNHFGHIVVNHFFFNHFFESLQKQWITKWLEKWFKKNTARRNTTTKPQKTQFNNKQTPKETNKTQKKNTTTNKNIKHTNMKKKKNKRTRCACCFLWLLLFCCVCFLCVSFSCLYVVDLWDFLFVVFFYVVVFVLFLRVCLQCFLKQFRNHFLQ